MSLGRDVLGRLDAGHQVGPGLQRYAGLVPATIACVFISAMGDRGTSLKEAFLLSIGVAIFGAVVFYFLLKVNLPLFGEGT